MKATSWGISSMEPLYLVDFNLVAMFDIRSIEGDKSKRWPIFVGDTATANTEGAVV